MSANFDRLKELIEIQRQRAKDATGDLEATDTYIVNCLLTVCGESFRNRMLEEEEAARRYIEDTGLPSPNHSCGPAIAWWDALRN